MEYVIAAVVGVVCLAAGIAVGYMIRKSAAEKTIGSAEKEAERDITHNVNADFIKLGHHGSDSSSSKSSAFRLPITI